MAFNTNFNKKMDSVIGVSPCEQCIVKPCCELISGGLVTANTKQCLDYDVYMDKFWVYIKTNKSKRIFGDD